jgi:cytoskeletal protein CcmA (bactofilin family)
LDTWRGFATTPGVDSRHLLFNELVIQDTQFHEHSIPQLSAHRKGALMFSRKHKLTHIDTLIGEGVNIHGDVVFSGGLRVDGYIKGNVSGAGDKPCALVLSEKGRVDGEIHATRVVINGEVAGPVEAAEYLELLPRARVTGDVSYRAIEVHVGAVVNGRLVPDQRTPDLKLVQIKPQLEG